MKAIKALVIFMGLLLVAGIGLLAYGVVNKGDQQTVTAADPAPAAPRPSAPAALRPSAPDAPRPSGGFGTIEVPLPPGTHVEQMAVAGERVVLRVTGGGTDRLVVLEPASGRVAGSFVLTPEPVAR